MIAAMVVVMMVRLWNRFKRSIVRGQALASSTGFVLRHRDVVDVVNSRAIVVWHRWLLLLADG